MRRESLVIALIAAGVFALAWGASHFSSGPRFSGIRSEAARLAIGSGAGLVTAGLLVRRRS